MTQGRLEAADRADTFVSHSYPEQLVDLGEVRLNYAAVGDPSLPPLLLIPGQTESWWGYEQALPLLAERFRCYALYARTVIDWAASVLPGGAEEDSRADR